jgi:RNA ligase (TIGR02306 family)
MSTFTVTIEQLTIHPHNNADALELAQVGEYRAVVPKGVYVTGDYALYIPEQAILPGPLIEELGLVGKLAGKAKNRVKAIRLRGEVSQGIVCRPEALHLDWDPDNDMLRDDEDYAEELGIEKWVPEVPAHMSGEVEAAPELIRWVDIENLQRYPDIFRNGEPVVATEKIHGTCCLFTYDMESGQVWVSSKGHGEKNLALVESETNLYWRAVRAAGLKEKAQQLANYASVAAYVKRIAIFGEVFGAGVQDLHYGANVGRNETLGYRAFDIKLDDNWIEAREFQEVCERLLLPTVPVLYSGPFDLEALKAVASGKTEVGGDNIREGVVIRPADEEYSPITGGRKIAKLISPAYLLRKGEVTEYE